MDKVKEYLLKIIKKSGDEQAYYSYYKENRSTIDKPLYIANIVWSKAGLSPLQISAFSLKEMTEDLKKYYRAYNTDTLKLRYHRNQILANELSIKHHNKMIEAYSKPEKKVKK